jgi:hypothetical protein
MSPGPWSTVCAFGILILICTGSGCSIFQRFRQSRPEAPVVLAPQSSLDQIVSAIHQNSERARQVRADVRVSMTGVPAMLRGDLFVERPNRLRLTAGVMGLSGFDVGSNEKEFWIWKQAGTPGDPPALYFARHDEYATSGLQEQLQLQPDWLLDGLGLISFDPGDRHVGPNPRSDGRLEIVSYMNQGPQSTIRVATIDAKSGVVVRQTFYNQGGKRIAYVDSIQYQYLPEDQVALPKRIEIHVFAPTGEESKLSVDIGNYTLNALFGDPEKMWAMPNPPDVRRIDLSRIGQSPTAQIEAAPHVSSNWQAFPRPGY